MPPRLITDYTFQCGGLMKAEATADGGSEPFVAREVGGDATGHPVRVRSYEDGSQEFGCPELTDSLILANVEEGRGLCRRRCRAVYEEKGRKRNVKRTGDHFPCPYYRG